MFFSMKYQHLCYKQLGTHNIIIWKMSCKEPLSIIIAPHNDETPAIFPLWSSSIISSVSPFYKQCSVLSICSPSLFVLEPASLKMTLCSCSFMFPSAFYSASSAPLSRQPLQCSSSRAPLWTTVNFFLNAFSFWTLSIDSAIHLSR